ncbi:C-GCAxxG-C-C family protein [Desulfovibrio sp. DV]|uniref:C-GCAxxG-C-C family protein n=1 Tax=Desulfovibrio sp. DV TaxID=1844708 RepID=UPI00094BA66C|nr:C-GCAxxG-C-C family protein [Desulfovibrio sp. DV]
MNSPFSDTARIDALALAVGEKAASLFSHRKLLCAEAILVAINETFGQPVSEDLAVGMAAGLTAGLGDRGCLCGAVAGACAGLGIVCSRGDHAATRAAVRRESAAIHEAFTARHKSSCCRVLTKPVKNDASAHMAQCAALTGYGAELAVLSILRLRPELLDCPEAARSGEKRVCSRVRWLLSLFCR